MLETKHFDIRPFERKDQKDARRIILQGLEERFGFLDETLNPDIDQIYEQYILNGDEFFVGFLEECMVCTGALIKEADGIGRIVRVSVLKENRRSGLATLIMKKLEEAAEDKGYEKLVLETNEDWDSAVSFYKRIGYIEVERADGCVHMIKELS